MSIVNNVCMCKHVERCVTLFGRTQKNLVRYTCKIWNLPNSVIVLMMCRIKQRNNWVFLAWYNYVPTIIFFIACKKNKRKVVEKINTYSLMPATSLSSIMLQVCSVIIIPRMIRETNNCSRCDCQLCNCLSIRHFHTP